MEIVKQEAMVLLYTEAGLSLSELKNSLNEFCAHKNISIIEIMTLYDEYDYLILKRIFQIVKYSPENVALITNRSLQSLIPIFAIFSILETINSGNAIDLVLNFLKSFKENSIKTDYRTSVKLTTENAGFENFHIILSDEIRQISDWMSNVKYEIVKSMMVK